MVKKVKKKSKGKAKVPDFPTGEVHRSNFGVCIGTKEDESYRKLSIVGEKVQILYESCPNEVARWNVPIGQFFGL
jgi:hypothetical protein